MNPLPQPLSPSHHPPKPSSLEDGPISPPLESLPYLRPAKENKKKHLSSAIAFGTIITVIVGLILFYFKISINVILPVLASIWVGSITLIYNTKN